VAQYRAGDQKVRGLPRLRRLRRESTDAELALWRQLRGSQLAGAKFRRQHQFGPYVLDFFCPATKLVIEVDGGQHYTNEGIASDGTRTRFLEANGLTVLRFTDTEVLTQIDAVAERILEALGRG
jgi:very-short-patch-repair endonuclease